MQYDQAPEYRMPPDAAIPDEFAVNPALEFGEVSVQKPVLPEKRSRLRMMKQVLLASSVLALSPAMLAGIRQIPVQPAAAESSAAGTAPRNGFPDVTGKAKDQAAQVAAAYQQTDTQRYRLDGLASVSLELGTAQERLQDGTFTERHIQLSGYAKRNADFEQKNAQMTADYLALPAERKLYFAENPQEYFVWMLDAAGFDTDTLMFYDILVDGHANAGYVDESGNSSEKRVLQYRFLCTAGL